MKNGSKLIKIAAILALLVLIVMAAVPTFAWLVDTVSTQFRLGADPSPRVALYMATAQKAQVGTPQEHWEYKWSSPVELTDMKTGGTFGAAFDPSNLNALKTDMGKIDSLDPAFLDESNYVWFCLRVHEEEGLKFKDIQLEFNQTEGQHPFRFFGSIWDQGKRTKVVEMTTEYPGAGPLLQNIYKDKTTVSQLLEVASPAARDSFISAAAPVTGPMPGSAELKAGGYVGDQKPMKPAMAADADPYYQASAVDAEGYYYIYFRMGPNLNAYYNLIEGLTYYMPCYLSFNDMQVSIDIRKD